MIPNSYRIMKLRSGEQLICEIQSSGKDKFKVKRPMSIRNAMQFDKQGIQKEFTVLRDWLSHTDEINAYIPKDFVASILKPNEQMATLYDREKDLLDRDVGVSDIFPMSPLDDLKKIIDKELEQTIKEELEALEEEEKNGDMLDPKNEMMVVSLALPLDALKKMFDEGILDKSDFEGLNFDEDPPREKITDEHTPDGDGSNWTDWSLDPRDYISDDDKEKDSE